MTRIRHISAFCIIALGILAFSSRNCAFEESVDKGIFIEGGSFEKVSILIGKGDYNINLGAYILEDKATKGKIYSFEEVTQKEHLVYVMYPDLSDVKSTRDFLLKTYSVQKIPYLAFKEIPKENQLKEILEVLRNFNRECVIEFALEDGEAFRLNFERASDIIREITPGVHICLGLDREDCKSFEDKYPKSTAYDLISLCVFADGGNELVENISADVSFFCKKFGESKPLVLNIGVSHFSADNARYYIYQSCDMIGYIYGEFVPRFPEICLVNYMSIDLGNFFERGEASEDYSVTSDERVLFSYQSSIKNYGSGALEMDKRPFNSGFVGYVKNGRCYAEEAFFKVYSLKRGKSLRLNGKELYEINEKIQISGAEGVVLKDEM